MLTGDHDDPWQLMASIFYECEKHLSDVASVMENADRRILYGQKPDNALFLEQCGRTTRHVRYLRLIAGPRNQP